MIRSRFVLAMLVIACVLSMGTAAMAAEVDCDATYCFTFDDFTGDEHLAGICITQLPDADAGTVMLGSRVIRSGDILTASQLEKLTLDPLRTPFDRDAVVTYLPIYEDRVEKPATVTIAIRGKEDKAPVARDSSLETYKNMENKGVLQASDPEGEALTYTLSRKPKRGSVTLGEDGSFVYKPKKNKVGVDSFTYTATDPAGNVSRTATVTIQVLKPTSSKQYRDTVDTDCRFEAEWLRNTGLFEGETISGEECFYPDKNVSRGEFLAMVVKALDIPLEDASYEGVSADTPAWLKPYLAAALRSGLTAGLPETETGSFAADQAITGAEAAVMLQNALDLSISQQTLENQESENAREVPAWASFSLTALEENGIALSDVDKMTRADAARVMYRVSHLAPDAPGTAVLRRQK